MTLKVTEPPGFDRRVQNRKDSVSPSFLHTLHFSHTGMAEHIAHYTISASVWCMLTLDMHFRTNHVESFKYSRVAT